MPQPIDPLLRAAANCGREANFAALCEHIAAYVRSGERAPTSDQLLLVVAHYIDAATHAYADASEHRRQKRHRILASRLSFVARA